MKGAITLDNMEWFEPLMTHTAAKMIRNRVPLYAVGVAEEATGTACGALVGYARGGCFHIVSLFVSPGYRLCGYGSQMIGNVVAACRDAGMGLEISFSDMGEETETLTEFLNAWDFREEMILEGEIYKISLKEALKTSYRKPGGTECVHRISQCTERQIRELSRQAYEREMPVPEKGFFADTVEKEISVVYMQKLRPAGYLVFDRSLAGKMTLCALGSFENNPYIMVEMMTRAMQFCKEKYPLDTEFYMQAVNDISAHLIHKVFPTAKSISHSYYLRAN